MEVSGHLHGQATLPPGEEPPGNHLMAGWVGPVGSEGHPITGHEGPEGE